MSSSSEREPLVSFAHYRYDSNVVPNKRGKSLRKLGVLLFVTISVVCGLTVFAQRPWASPPVSVHNNTRRYQMEATHPAIVPARWQESDECSDDRAFTLTLALKEENMDKLDEYVMAVSDPTSPTFHEYWTAKQIQETFAPSSDTLDAVKGWLNEHGFSESMDNVRYRSQYGNLLHVDVTCSTANDLLGAKYLVYKEADTGRTHLRVEDGVYSVPNAVAGLIDFIEPTIRFPIQSHSKEATKLDVSRDDFGTIDGSVTFDGYNTPSTLYALYGMDSDVLSDDLLDLVASGTEMTQGIVSFDEEYYDDDDLELAWEYLGYAYDNSISQMTRVPANQSSGYGAEAELDTQYITATGLGLDTFVYYIDGVNDDYFSALVEDVLEYESPPSVVSISYGADEYEWGKDYCSRANQGFGKLALLGTTVLASSGDDGALGDDDDCYDGTKYIASFPASATYVTAVGGTLGGSSASLEANGTTEETAWYYSGGGFSIYFDEPEWQHDAVSNYFSQDIEYPDPERYSVGMRGVPDVSAQSVDYIIAYEDAFYSVSGTSCSSPTFAGMVAMWNVKRESEQKKKLGFLNPVLYLAYNEQASYNEYFNDVVSGYNEGCSCDDDIAWYAADGWDPITGCGTPKFDRLLQFMNDVA